MADQEVLKQLAKGRDEWNQFVRGYKYAHVHPKANRDVTAWVLSLLEANVELRVPEIADYEVRRSFILSNLALSIARLDELATTLGYETLNTDVMKQRDSSHSLRAFATSIAACTSTFYLAVSFSVDGYAATH